MANKYRTNTNRRVSTSVLDPESDNAFNTELDSYKTIGRIVETETIFLVFTSSWRISSIRTPKLTSEPPLVNEKNSRTLDENSHSFRCLSLITFDAKSAMLAKDCGYPEHLSFMTFIILSTRFRTNCASCLLLH